MLVSIIEGILIAICLKLIGLPYAITIGAAVCVLGIVPYLGIITAFIPAVLLAWFTWGDFQHVLIVSGIFLAVNQFDGWIIQPKIVGDSVELHPLTVMFSVLIWTLILGGLIGALLAVPPDSRHQGPLQAVHLAKCQHAPHDGTRASAGTSRRTASGHTRRFGPRLNSGILPTILSGKL